MSSRFSLLLCPALCLAAAAPRAQESVPIVPGVAVERTVANGDTQTFQLPIVQGQALRISVDQLGADVSIDVSLAATASTPVHRDDPQKRHFGRELLIWPAPGSGTAQIAIHAQSVLPNAARYRLAATLIDPSGTLTAALKASDETVPLIAQATRASAEQAAPKLQAAAQQWLSLGDRELAARAFYDLGLLQRRQLARHADAIATLTEALHIYEELGLATETVDALGEISEAQFDSSQPQQAIATLERALPLAPLVDPVNSANIDDAMARAYVDIDIDQAIQFGERAAEAFRVAGEYDHQSGSLENLAVAYARLRQGDIALQRITQAVELARKYGKPGNLAALTLSLGRIQLDAGDDEAALATFHRAQELAGENLNVKLIGQLFEGRLYNREGNIRAARELLERTLAAVPAQAKSLWAGVATELGSILAQDGDPQRALTLQKQALDIVEAGQSRIGTVTVLRDLTTSYRALGDIAQANAMLDRAMTIASQAPANPYEPVLLRERARNARAAEDLEQARDQINAAIARLDSTRGQLQTQALRTSFGGTRAGYYADAIDIEMALHAKAPQDGHDARAFELFERGRARSLTDLLSEGRIDVTANVDPALVAERRRLQQQLGSKDATLRGLGTSAAAKERAATLQPEIEDLVRQLDVLDARIRAASPRYAALTRPAALSFAETQQLLDDQTVLLAFSVGKASSWGWAITHDAVRSFALPAGTRIEEQAQRVYADLTARQRHDGALADMDKRLAVSAAGLGDLIFAPIAEALRHEWRTHRLAIVATGPLEYIPFSALPEPAAGTTTPRPLLVAQHEIVRLPSTSVLALLRREEATPTAATTELAVLADPVYAADDPRVRARRADGRLAQRRASGPSVRGPREPARGQAPAPAPATDPTRQPARTSDARYTSFERLVFSRREAQAIATLARGRGVMEALDFSANVETMASPAVARARIVHIASHGIFNSDRPELSGFVLSMVDEYGRPHDGVFHLYDVFNLKLSADLVVLSGCETGLGRQMNGEGLIGLTRGFMYAGAPRIVASLWQVDDVATAELMRRFYAGMLQQKLPPAAALHAAQRAMASRAPWRSPYYWAAFTLVGDWR